MYEYNGRVFANNSCVSFTYDPDKAGSYEEALAAANAKAAAWRDEFPDDLVEVEETTLGAIAHCDIDAQDDPVIVVERHIPARGELVLATTYSIPDGVIAEGTVWFRDGWEMDFRIERQSLPKGSAPLMAFGGDIINGEGWTAEEVEVFIAKTGWSADKICVFEVYVGIPETDGVPDQFLSETPDTEITDGCFYDSSKNADGVTFWKERGYSHLKGCYLWTAGFYHHPGDDPLSYNTMVEHVTEQGAVGETKAAYALQQAWLNDKRD